MTKKIDEKVVVIVNEKVAKNIYCLQLQGSAIAKSILPGQFVHLKMYENNMPVLRRPFSVFDCDANAGIFTILYEIKGRGTAMMCNWRCGFETFALGPLGNTWSEDKVPSKALLVGGGLGSAPLFMLAKKLIKNNIATSVVLGAKTRELLVTLKSYENLNLKGIYAVTDDGSCGSKGFCPDEAEKLMTQENFDYVATCGPPIVMKKVAKMCIDKNIDCEVSLEEKMACGVGACKTCVVNTKRGKLKACCDGPIFDAREVLW